MLRQQSHLSAVARSGCAGICTFCLGALALVFLPSACILLAISGLGDSKDDPDFQDEDFKESQELSKMQNITFHAAGIILLVISLILIVITLCMCSYVCQKVSTATANQADHGGEILVRGAAPPPGTAVHAARASLRDPAPPYPGIIIPPSSPPGVEPRTPPPTYDDFINKGPNFFMKKTKL